MALKFDRHIDSTAAEVPVKFQSDRTILNTNLVASRLYEILRKDVFRHIWPVFGAFPWNLFSVTGNMAISTFRILRRALDGISSVKKERFCMVLDNGTEP